LRIKLGNGLIPINLLVLLLIAIIIMLPATSFRIVLGIPFLLFLPGYVLMTALYPKKEGPDAIERVALSFGLSIALVPLIGLILNYTLWDKGGVSPLLCGFVHIHYNNHRYTKTTKT